MTAKYLAESGVFLGEELLGANFFNPHGHYEDLEVIRLHDRLLQDNGTDWTVDRRIVPRVGDDILKEISELVERRNVQRPLWGFKDPRVCQFLPLWKSVIPDSKVLILFRDPTACAESLHQRHAIDAARHPAHKFRPFYEKPDLALKIWTVSNEALADFAEAFPEDTLVISHRNLLAGFPLGEEMNRRWGLEMKPANMARIHDTKLGRRAGGVLRVSNPAIAKRTRNVWNRLVRLEEKTLMSSDGKPTDHPPFRLEPAPHADMLLMEAELLRFENEYLRKAISGAGQVADKDLYAVQEDLNFVLTKANKFPYSLVFGRKRRIRVLSKKYGIRD